MKAWRYATVFGFVLFHFTMLALGILRVNLPKPFWNVQFNYGRITGAGGSFGFFSPNVPREIDVVFLVDRKDKTEAVRLQDIVPPEVKARVGNMVHLLAKNFKEEKILRSVAASLSAAIFREREDATQVTLKASLYNFPSLDRYRLGTRTQIVDIYSASFQKASQVAESDRK